MKFKTLVITLLCFSKTLFSQDSLHVSTVVDSSFKTPQYVVAYDDVFLNKKEAKWLVKANLTPLAAPLQILSFEHKLNTNLSLNYALGGIINVGAAFEKRLLLNVQPRWYFKNKDEKTVNNLNGNYIGLNALYTLNKINGNQGKWGLVANYGIQRRVFNNWYFDYQVGIGMDKFNINNDNNTKKGETHYWLHNSFSLGLAFGGKKSQSNACDLFNCFEEEQSLWKLNFRDIYKSYTRYGYAISINPEYERKIGQSSFSINTGIDFDYSNYKIFGKGYALKAELEPRYYYNLKKRIAKGKSANNLSGSYISFNLNVGYVNGSYNSVAYDSVVTQFTKRHGTAYNLEPRWGIQRRLFKNGFLDFSFTPFQIQKNFVIVDEIKENGIIIKSEPYPTSDFNLRNIVRLRTAQVHFKIGFAF